MKNGPPVSRSTLAYMRRKLACVDQKRSHALGADVARLLADMQSPDGHVRARAVREVCPCRLPWEVFGQVRTAARRLQRDPSPLVRANAQHVEEDARELASLEALREWLAEREPEVGWEDAARRAERGDRRQRRRRRGGDASDITLRCRLETWASD
jgi:hypothetical protein